MAHFDRSTFRSEPTSEDIFAANAQIHQHERAISSIEDQINQVMLELHRLRAEQKKHHDGIRYCKGVVTLARRIPEELLSKIFEHCSEDGWTRAPLAVSQVCSAWRKASRAPRVWSRVFVDCDSPDVVPRLHFWLSKARAAPLDIMLSASSRVPAFVLTEVMDLLRRRANQWRILSFDTQTVTELQVFISVCGTGMMNLEELDVKMDTLSGDGDNNEEDASELKNCCHISVAPKLHTVRYICNVIPLAPIFPIHIRELELIIAESPTWRPLSASSLLTVLQDLPKLQKLMLSMPLLYERQFVPESESTRTVTLSQLETLIVYGPTDLNELLPHFRSPALRHLHLRSLEDLGYRQRPIGPSLVQFLEGSSPPLELLELHDIDLSPEYFARSFALMPAMQELRLHESSISDATISLLNGPKGLCPRLTHVDLRWCGHLTGTALVALVCTRQILGISSSIGVTGENAAANSDPIAEVGVINCCFVKEQDVLDLAKMSVCRVVMRDFDDYCRPRDCCGNVRYRNRLRIRYMTSLSLEERSRIRLVA